LGEAAQGDQKQQGRVGKEIGERREGRGGGEVSGGGEKEEGKCCWTPQDEKRVARAWKDCERSPHTQGTFGEHEYAQKHAQ